MEQVLIGGVDDPVQTANIEYNSLNNGMSWRTTESISPQIISTGGTLKNLRIKLDGSPGSGKSYTFTLRVNGAGTTLTTTISNAETSGFDITHEVIVLAGDLVGIECSPAGTPTARRPRWTVVFESDNENESLILSNSANALNTTTTEYDVVSGTFHILSATEDDHRMICPTNGTIKNLYVLLDISPGTSPDAYRFTLRVNGVSSALTVTITANDTTGNDTVNTVSVVAGDALTMMVEPLNTPSATPLPTFGMTFVADLDGESIILGQSIDALNIVTTEYNYVVAKNIDSWNPTESDRYMLAQECTLGKLFIRLKNAPGTGNSFTFTIRRNGASPGSGLAVTISGNDTTGNEVANIITVADDDDLGIQSVPVSSPGGVNVYWGLVVNVVPEGLHGEIRPPGGGGGTGTGTDFTSFILGARTERGRDDELGHAQAGIAEFECDNSEGDFNPENTGGAFFGILDLGSVIEFYEKYGGVKYYHFTGKIAKILPHDEHDNPTAYILAVDGMDDLAGTEVDTALRTDTETGVLVGDVLDEVNWPAGDRDLDTGIDTLQVAWFHKIKALAALQLLEDIERGFFYIDVDGIAIWENRHARVTGAGVVSQHDFEDVMVEVVYEWSKRELRNWARVTGTRYTEDANNTNLWSAFTGAAGAPFVPQAETLTLWADLAGPLSSFTALVKGTHWNANSTAAKSGTDLSNNISIVVTQHGQALEIAITNAGTQGAYMVVPDSPPAGSPANRTLLIFGKLYQEETMTIVKEDTTSRDKYGKRTVEVTATFKSNPNDLVAYADWLITRFKDPLPTPKAVRLVARTAWPDDTIKIQCLSRKISDRVTLKSTKGGYDRDFYIDKVIQDYGFQEGIFQHETTWQVVQAEGTAEELYWLLGTAGFGELGQKTVLGF